MKRLFILLSFAILIVTITTPILLYAQTFQEGVTPIDVKDIRISTSTQYAIEIIALTPQGLRNFIVQDSIPHGIEEYITTTNIDLICKQLLHEIQQGMLSLVWIDQIYAIIQSTRFQKDAIRFKYLFVARLQENLPPDFIDSSHTIADVYDIPPPHNIESSIMPVPAIPDYSDILLSQEEANILLEEEITKNKIRIYDRYPTTQQVQDSLEKQQTEKKETVEPSEQNIVTTSKKLPDNNKSTVTENPKIHDITLQKTTDKNESIHMKR